MRGELLASLLRAEVLPHKNVGDVRGMGLFWGVEIVQDKETKQPFAFEDKHADRVAEVLLRRGVAVYNGYGCVSEKLTKRLHVADPQADGWDGDHIMLCPPYTITEDEVRFLVREVRIAIEVVLGQDP